MKTKNEFNFARLGLGVGAIALFASTAYMNISGWVDQAPDVPQAIANGTLAAGFELMALCGLSWAGYQFAKKRKFAGSVTAAIAVAAIVFNTFAAQNFLHIQADTAINAIEMSGQSLSVVQDQIAVLNEQINGLIEQNNGNIPRPVDAVNAQYGHLDPDKNPINMGRRDSEIALREEYNRLQSEIIDLKNGSVEAAVGANDVSRTVMPTSMLGPFIWALEAIKGTIFFALGTASGEQAAKPKRKMTKKDRQQWAIIRAKENRSQLG